MGITAIAIYEFVPILPSFADGSIAHFALSYEPTEDNELPLREGERIIEIEAPSEEWWQGKNEQGQVGLFPGKFIHFDVLGDWVTQRPFSELR